MAISSVIDMSFRQTLQDNNIKPKRHRGQNFLIDKNILKKIVAAAEISPRETIIEIGAGTGVLTQELAKHASRVIAVELDTSLIPVLTKAVAEYRNVTVIQDNALDIQNSRFGGRDGSYAIVANIPYNITSRLIRKFLEERPRPSRMILLVQKEVAERMQDSPPNMNLLALSVQYYASSKLLFGVSRHCFSPKPSVESAVIRIVPKNQKVSPSQEKNFFLLIHAAFQGKRKRLVSTMADATGLSKKNVEELLTHRNLSLNVRPQELSMEQWLQLVSDVNHLSTLP